MALPQAPEARRFYQVAKQRLQDAWFLLDGDRTTGAIYLAGYSVECILKTLSLSLVPEAKRSRMLDSFRGSNAHNYDWLKSRYFRNGGTPFPPAIAKSFSLVDPWSTDLRYEAGTSRRKDAESFLMAAEEIILWADGRL